MDKNDTDDQSPSDTQQSNDDSDEKTEPAEWRPYSPEEFSKGTEEVAELYRSEPRDLSGSDEDEDTDEQSSNSR